MAKDQPPQQPPVRSEEEAVEAGGSTDLDNDDAGTCSSDDEGFSEIGEVGDTEVHQSPDPCLAGVGLRRVLG